MDHHHTYAQLRASWQMKTNNRDGTKKLSNGTIFRILQENKMTTKQLRNLPMSRNLPQVKAKRKEYCKRMGDLDESTMIFLDESGFNLHLKRSRGRSKKGERAYQEVPDSKGNNITMVAA